MAFLFVIDGADALAGDDGSGEGSGLGGEGGGFEGAGEGVGDFFAEVVGVDLDLVAAIGEEVFESGLSGVVMLVADFDDCGWAKVGILFVGETVRDGEEAIGSGGGFGLGGGVAVLDGGEAGPDDGGVLGDFADFDAGAEKGGGLEEERGGEEEEGGADHELLSRLTKRVDEVIFQVGKPEIGGWGASCAFHRQRVD